MNKIVRLLALSLVVALTACDAVVAPEDHAAGVVILRADGSEAARFVLQGNTTSGGLSVAVGQTATYRVRVLTESGDVVPVDGTEYDLRNPGVVIGLAATIAIQGDQLLVTGINARNTSITFHLFHADHEEFLVSGITLAVQ